MEPQSALDTITIGAAVVSLVQLAKWAGLKDGHGPLAVMVFSLLGVALWGYSNALAFVGPNVWEYFAGWINVMLVAAGIFGFSRAGANTLTKMKDGGGGV